MNLEDVLDKLKVMWTEPPGRKKTEKVDELTVMMFAVPVSTRADPILTPPAPKMTRRKLLAATNTIWAYISQVHCCMFAAQRLVGS